MRSPSRLAATAALMAAANAASLSEVCTVSNVQASLPSNGTLLGINLLPSTVAVSAVYNATAGTDSTSTYSYCSFNVSYTHTGKDDTVVLHLAFPEPSEYENRWYLAGGGGYELSTSATGGLEYGAASGATDAGYDAFSYSYDEVNLYGNGSINWDNTYMFSFQALGELTKVGKAISENFYGLSNGTKIYTYFEGCSDGGRQGMSQAQRWGTEYDGIIAGAPAFRQAQQQVNHIFPAEIEHTMDYFPPVCALSKIVNETIKACDPLDGRTDGVVSRTDLCKLHFNLSSIIGKSYYCAASSSSSLGFGFSKRAEGSTTSDTPTQNGTVTAEDVAVAQAVYDGLHNSKGEQAYLSWQIAAELADAEPTWDNTTSSWTLDIPSTGGEFVTRMVELVEVDNLSNLDGVTYDTLVSWMTIAMVRYMDTLQTTLPDLTPFVSSGGKLLHFHGESDPSVPTPSSIHYWQSVLNVMYPNSTFNQSVDELKDWYQFYLIPGAAHCGTNTLQPGPYPEDNMEIMIDWVENGVTPTRLNATVSSGTYEGETQMLCQWPQRPYWVSNSSFDCAFDQASYDSWTYTFPAFDLPVY